MDVYALKLFHGKKSRNLNKRFDKYRKQLKAKENGLHFATK